jgi:glycosyltransferase involved in cell wall biosynthesis
MSLVRNGHADCNAVRQERRSTPVLADVVCLSHLRWGFVYQRPNHLMARCARQRRVFFVEEPAFDAQGPYLALDEVAPNLVSAVPHLPEGTTLARAERHQRAMLEHLFAREGVRSPLLWFYTPMALGYAGHIPAGAIVYDCMDELSAFEGAPPELHVRERALFAYADLVFTGGQSLYEAKRPHHPSVHAFPSSVDAEHFARARTGTIPVPIDQQPIPGPRLGFFGVIDERMDRELLARIADAHVEWHIVLLGPVVKIDPESLPRRPNIHYLGHKPYEELPAYIAGWDVAIMPFAMNEATRFISPTKTLEYLAAGKPVVSTPIRDVVRPLGERDLVRVGSGAGFVHAIEEALLERGTAKEAIRRDAADAHVARTSWDCTWEGMDTLVRDAAGRRARVA